MAKNTGRMALYEAIRKSQKSLIPVGRAQRGAKKPKKGLFFRTRAEKLMAQAEARSHWPPREMARPVRRSKRMRISMKVLFFIVLGLSIVVLIGIKLGTDFAGQIPDNQDMQLTDSDGMTEANNRFKAFQSDSLENTETEETRNDQGSFARRSEPDPDVFLQGSGGNNVIVIVTIDAKRQPAILTPVQVHYAAHGIETVVEKRGSFYFLYTKNKFYNPKRPGTDGYDALRKVREIGLLYKSPTTEANFGIRPFQDAYGMKIR